MLYHYIHRDQRRRHTFFNREVARLSQLFFLKDSRLPQQMVDYYRPSKLKELRTGSFTAIKNRCFETGQGRAVYRFFGLSRSNLRTAFLFGRYSGVRKSSW